MSMSYARMSFLLIAALVCSNALGVVAYDNLAGAGAAGFSTSGEYGDQISLAGSARTVTDFDFQYQLRVNSGVSTGLETARIRFYQNNGGATASGPAPESILWDSGDFSIIITDQTTRPLSVPNIDVPTSFTWTVAFGNIGGNETASLILHDPPAIGSSESFYWRNDAGTWNPATIPASATPANFGARVTAVPEPAGIAVVLGFGAMLARRRL